ncbi:hypothetical protein Vadar_013710 [Vaccinium darrowii]|uniref:Uncharacterized protein n=1 Tax=Vaccinium darrowii TaxID=229202 RepID=A0ACB7XQF1_9ERIC|nr:hypothetical protein Vadar_013710 [Vaccinium darrowii]
METHHSEHSGAVGPKQNSQSRFGRGGTSSGVRGPVGLGILSSFLSRDEEAAEIIRQIATGLMPDDTESFAEVKRRIENYHTRISRTRIATWVNEVMRNYFRSPWTTIAVFYAVLAIFLSIVQTYFTIFPSPDKR